MLLASAFSKENSAISLEKWVLVFKMFTPATRNLRDDGPLYHLAVNVLFALICTDLIYFQVVLIKSLNINKIT